MGTIGTLAPAATSSSGAGGLLILALPLLLIGWLFWTNSRRVKQMRSFSESLNIGDQVVTSSGIVGTIRQLDASTAWLEVSEGTIIRFDRRALAMKQAEAASTPATSEGSTDTHETGQ